MSKDSRGVTRGHCVADRCPCDGYEGGAEGKKCYRCGHSPGKHKNLDATVQSHQPATGAAGFSQTPPTTTSQLYSTGYHSPPPPPHYHQRQAPVVQLPTCQADGCFKHVWYDHGLQGDLGGGFTYCSPKCRDRHLLPINQQQLEKDLKDLKQELYRAAAADSPTPMFTRQSSNKSSPLTSRTDTSLPVSPTGVNKKQKPVTVVINKAAMARKQLGLILSKKKVLLNEGKDIGFVIVGVVKGSPVFSKVQHDEIRLLDVIETINDTPCGKILSSDADLQERFERYLEDKQTVKLLLNRTLSLPPISSPICYARKNYVDYKHLVVLRNFPDSVSEHFGLTLSSDGGKALVVVKGVSKDSPADMSRMKYNDKIRMYVIASPEEIHSSKLVSDTCLVAVEKDLENAQTTGMNVILFVQREISFT